MNLRSEQNRTVAKNICLVRFFMYFSSAFAVSERQNEDTQCLFSGIPVPRRKDSGAQTVIFS